jgi:hypothetical protein
MAMALPDCSRCLFTLTCTDPQQQRHMLLWLLWRLHAHTLA